MAKLSLYANPYDISAKGWYFDSLKEWEKKFKQHAPVEEYEIDFIDGSDEAQELFEAMKVTQGDIEEYFEKLDEYEDLSDEEQAGISYLMQNHRESFKDALEKVQDGDVPVYAGDIEDYASQYIDDMGGVAELGKKTIESYFDYDSFGGDIRQDLIDAAEGDEDEIERIESMSDTELAEDYIENSGWSAVSNPENYFDLEKYARDLDYGGDASEFRFKGKTYTTTYN